MEQCKIFDCEWHCYHPGVIIDKKVYVLDQENKPADVSTLIWGPWEEKEPPLMAFYTGDNDFGSEENLLKWGFVNLLTGEMVVPPIYEYVSCFCNVHLAKVSLKQKEGFIDKTGKVIGGIVWDRTHSFFDTAEICAVRKGDLWGYIGRDGKFVLEPQFEEAEKWQKLFLPSGEEVQEVLAWVKKYGKYGCLTGQGTYQIEPLYDDVRDFWLHYYTPVKVYGKWGFVEPAGQFAVPPQFSDIGECTYDFYMVKQEGTWGILSTDLEIIMPEEGEKYVIYKEDKVSFRGRRVSSRRKIKV